MSPHLFNAVIDWVIEDLDLSIGALIGEGRTNVCAFADDLVLIAATPLSLQSLLDSLDRALGLVGLEISAGTNGKSASLRIDIDGRAKRWVVNTHPFLRVTRLPEDEGLIPTRSPKPKNTWASRSPRGPSEQRQQTNCERTLKPLRSAAQASIEAAHSKSPPAASALS